MSEKKVESSLKGKAQRSVKDIQILIGSANISQRFREDSSKVYKPITDTLKTKEGKDLLFWGEIEYKVLEELKRRCALAPILA